MLIVPSGLNTSSPLTSGIEKPENDGMTVQFPAKVVASDRQVESTASWVRLWARLEFADGSWLETITQFPPGTVLDEYAEGFDPAVRGEVVSAQSNRAVSLDPQTGNVVLLDEPPMQRN